MRHLFFCLLLVPVLLHAEPLPGDEAAAYLAKVAASRPQKAAITVHFRETRTAPMLARPSVVEGELTFQPPDRFRREAKNGDVMVSDGATLWIYSPAEKTAERYKLGSRMADAFAGFMAAFDLRDVDRLFRYTVERAGALHRVTLVPKRRAERRLFEQMTLELGPDQKLRRVAWTSPDRESTTLEFSHERPAGKVSFTFEPPAGTSVRAPLGK
jgi:outer membrane lipoprotein-sorting protein